MKTIIVAVLILISTYTSAQTYLAGGTDPLQPGFRLDAGQIFNRNIIYGYSQLSKIYTTGFDASHAKFGMGYGHEVSPHGLITIGLNYNKYYDLTDNYSTVDLNDLYDISVDLGAVIYLDCKRRTYIYGARTDVLNWETAISFGWIIGSKKICDNK